MNPDDVGRINRAIEAFRLARRPSMQEALTSLEDRHRLASLPPDVNPDGFTVRLVRRPPRRVAYRLVQRPFESGRVPASAERLISWAQSRGVSNGHNKQHGSRTS